MDPFLILTAEPDDDWRDHAACLGADPNTMQPERALESEVEDALRHCTACPVRDECKALALSQAMPYGIHAGQWWGPQPVWEVEKVCERDECAQPFRTPRDGARSAIYCSARCRVTAHRARVVPA